MYFVGRGVPKDMVTAYMWISLAADSGFQPAQKLLPTVSQSLTAEQIADAKLKAQKWKSPPGIEAR